MPNDENLLASMLASWAGLNLLVAAILFLPGGSLGWTAGWAFMALFAGFQLGMNPWLLRNNPDLLRERLSMRTADLVGRSLLEERTLKAQLPGYAESMGRVRYRLIPGIW